MVIKDLGVIDYLAAYQIQKEAVQRVLNSGDETLFLCEHPAVITKGRMSHDEHIYLEVLGDRAKDIQIQTIDRGGDVTLHAPGQLVVYPILDLKNHGKDLRMYIRELEQVLIDLLDYFGIMARRHEEHTGVWVKDKKIASLGIGIKKWISFHGIGLNVSTDLSLFSFIKPCGLDVGMTTMEEEKGNSICIQDVKDKMVDLFQKSFNVNSIEG